MPSILQLLEIIEVTCIKTYVSENKKYGSVDYIYNKEILMNYVFLLKIFSFKL